MLTYYTYPLYPKPVIILHTKNKFIYYKNKVFITLFYLYYETNSENEKISIFLNIFFAVLYLLS